MSKLWQETLWGAAGYLFLVCLMGAPEWVGCIGGLLVVLMRRAV